MFFAYVHVFVFFFKQNDAYEVRIRDWSSDVCSSDLDGQHLEHDAPSYAEPGSGQFKDEDDEGDGVECIAGPGHGVGEEQPPELAGASHELESTEERRVGNECDSTGRSGWRPEHEKKKKNETSRSQRKR